MIGPEYATVAARALLGDTRGGDVPGVVWIALLEDDTELGARTAVANTDAVWGEAEGGAMNVTAIDWGVASGDWTVDAVALFDSSSGGAMIVSGPLVDPVTGDPAPVEVTEGASVAIAAGGLVVAVA